MAIEIIGIENLMENINMYITIDVRSQIEFEHAHIPNAFHLPIFDNEERKIIGTSYKQQSRQQAIKIGLQFFGKKLLQYIEA
ncbi:MAG: rhodanese-like domain-containing protein, partial [Sediminibacterium sp.]|nr:rhodanese-like domain-containing protein [Sediminibacterium sp.]